MKNFTARPSQHSRMFIVAIFTLGVALNFVFINNSRAETNPMITMTTNMGVIEIELDAEKAPESVKNFLAYAEKGHYDGLVFHRVIPDFMVQGGGFEPGMSQRPAPDNVDNEANNGLKNDRGTLAMARTPDPHSASAQFFINLKDNDFLNFTAPTPQGWGYAVFGKVVNGMDVVDAMAAKPTGSKSGHQDVPVDDIIIEKVEVTGG